MGVIIVQALLSEKQFNMLFNKSKDLVFLCKKVDSDYTYVYINEVASNLFRENVVGKKLSEIRLIELKNWNVKYYNMALKTNTQQNFQNYTVIQSQVHKYETTVIPIVDGAEQYVLAMTKEMALERDLQDKYRFIQSLFVKTFLSIVLMSKDAKILEANSTFIQTFNIDMERMRGKDFLDFDFMDDDTKDKLTKYLLNARQGHHCTTDLIRFIDWQGIKRSYTASFSPFIQEKEVVAVFIILQDITEYIEQEKVLRQTSHILEMFKQAMNVVAAISVTDHTGRIVDVNNHFVKRVGYTREEIIGQTHHLVNSCHHPPEFFRNLWNTISAGKVWQGEICNQNKLGVTYWNDTTIIPIVDVDGQITRYLGIYFNISEKKSVMTKLRNIERTFNVITENTNDLIIITCEDGIISYASPSYVRLLGYEEEELLGKCYSQLLQEESLQDWYNVLQNLQNHVQGKTVELKLKSKQGDYLWTEGHYNAVVSDDHDGLCQIIMVSREITERKERENKLIFMAYHDSLTHLPNRRYLDKEFPHLIENAKEQYRSIAIIYVDGDNFKVVNDVYGHEVGDEFIRQFSKALLKSVSLDDLVIRVGGDEFVIVLPNFCRKEEVQLAQIEAFIDRLRHHLHEGWYIDGHLFQPTASMGIAFYPKHGEALEKLIDLADQALCQSKLNQKNSYKICE